jgi:predicted MFS family arabinose efflux permease
MKENNRLYLENIISKLHFLRKPGFWIGSITSLLVAVGGTALFIYFIIYLMLRYE